MTGVQTCALPISLNSKAAFDSPTVLNKLVTPPPPHTSRVASASSDTVCNEFDDASTILDESGSLGPFLDSMVAKSKEIEWLSRPNRYGNPGKTAHLIPTFDILHRIYRENIAVKVGNWDEVHGNVIDLLIESQRHQGKGERLDVMDYLYHEMFQGLCEHRAVVYGPFVFKLICHA